MWNIIKGVRIRNWSLLLWGAMNEVVGALGCLKSDFLYAHDFHPSQWLLLLLLVMGDTVLVVFLLIRKYADDLGHFMVNFAGIILGVVMSITWLQRYFFLHTMIPETIGDLMVPIIFLGQALMFTSINFQE